MILGYHFIEIDVFVYINIILSANDKVKNKNEMNYRNY